MSVGGMDSAGMLLGEELCKGQEIQRVWRTREESAMASS